MEELLYSKLKKKAKSILGAISFVLFKKWAQKSIFFMDTHIFMNTHIQEHRLNTYEWGSGVGRRAPMRKEGGKPRYTKAG